MTHRKRRRREDRWLNDRQRQKRRGVRETAMRGTSSLDGISLLEGRLGRIGGSSAKEGQDILTKYGLGFDHSKQRGNQFTSIAYTEGRGRELRGICGDATMITGESVNSLLLPEVGRLHLRGPDGSWGKEGGA